jgi:DNA-binding transcriptional ArsR family regulator
VRPQTPGSRPASTADGHLTEIRKNARASRNAVLFPVWSRGSFDAHRQLMVSAIVILRALSCPTRLTIYGRLAPPGGTVCDLARHLGVVPSTVSHHLAQLIRAGLVRQTHRGSYQWTAARWFLVSGIESRGAEETSRLLARACPLPSRDVVPTRE